MPIVHNKGGALTLPDCTLRKGATMVDQGAWARARKHPAVVAYLASGRLEVQKGGAPSRAVAKEPAAPPAPPPEETELPDSVDADGDGKVDLGAMNARPAIEMVATLDLEAVDMELERETRSTVLSALEKRRAELVADGD